ncbi:LPS export ABC transporter periplasmic protein LptC [Chroococcidiopsis sp. FACHB-1243]|nr:LPS export ABC transporter periplasmic protein LptC [Chroococcidiopsis sp. [FACHB-1243]]
MAAPLVGVVLVTLLFGCEQRTQTAETVAQAPSSPPQQVQRDLTFNDVILEQSDKQGQLFWKVKSKQATYSKDRKTAQVENPVGQLFQDGKPLYDITAKTGEIQQDGAKLLLKGEIVAKAPAYNLVLRGNELEWQPNQDLLIVRDRLTGEHPQMQTVAKEARVRSRAGIVEFLDGVQATAKESNVQMQTERLTWQFHAQKLIGDRPIKFDRYQNNKIIDRGTAGRGEYDLKTNIATLAQNAQISLQEPPLQVNGNSLKWNVDTKTVIADQPVRVVQRQQQVTVSGDRGRLETEKQVAYMSGNVKGVGQKQQTVTSDALTWYIETQQMEATGNVVYQQFQPPATLKGQKAVGKLDAQNFVVSGGRVSTQFVPQP